MSRTAFSALPFFLVIVVPLQSYDEPNVSLIQTPRLVRLSLTGHSITSWRDHFVRSHRWFHGAVAAAWTASGIMSNRQLGWEFIPPWFIVIGLLITAALTSRRWVHILVMVLWLTLLALINIQLQLGYF